MDDQDRQKIETVIIQYSLDAANDRIRRLAHVARLADDWRQSNDVSDELHDALDALLPGDY